jgi:hypothetical protein
LAGSSPTSTFPDGATSANPSSSAIAFQLPATTASFVEPASCSTTSSGISARPFTFSGRYTAGAAAYSSAFFRRASRASAAFAIRSISFSNRGSLRRFARSGSVRVISACVCCCLASTSCPEPSPQPQSTARSSHSNPLSRSAFSEYAQARL